MVISNCLFLPTSKNPSAFSIQFVFIKLGALTIQKKLA